MSAFLQMVCSFVAVCSFTDCLFIYRLFVHLQTVCLFADCLLLLLTDAEAGFMIGL